MSFFAWRWGFWFRIFGWGLHLRPSRGYVPLFSERHGLRRAHYLLGVRIEVLKP